MCRGISCEVVYSNGEVLVFFGDPKVINADRDSHTHISKLHSIKEAVSELDNHFPFECVNPTDIADANTYSIEPDGKEFPKWYQPFDHDGTIRKELQKEINRRLSLVKKDGLWPGSLTILDGSVFAKSGIKSIGGSADFGSMTSAVGLENLTSIGGSAYFIILTSAVGLEKLTSIGGSAYFVILTSAVGLEKLTSIGGSANFGSMTSAVGLKKLTSIGGSAYFGSLTSAERKTLIKRLKRS
jgi:hypothetical protein